MKLLQSIGLSSLLGVSVVFADLHNYCGCGHRYGKTSETDAYWRFDTDATTYACERYRNRNRGDEQWNKCPDCKMDAADLDSHVGTPACFSWGWHLGGDEFDYYCGLKGLQGYCHDE
ncbi:hypothetical protein LZ31DRAFT_385737 [Colletotrichum somersetense]|nr:hypothetical protein LZ31DRAFT_385737 [Colletotrichum somersetense]